MNRKDFELVARAVKSMRFLEPLQRANVAHAIASDIERAENCSGFDPVKFLSQCGVKT